MPRLLDKAVRRAELAQAAIDAIADRGLDNVRLVDVAAAAGCTTGSLQHFFGPSAGKDAVLRLAVDEVMARLLDPARLAPGDPVAALAETLPLDATRRREWQVWLAFVGRAATDPALAALHADYYHRIGERLAAELPGAPADALIAAIDGVALRAVLEPDDWPAERQRAVLIRLITPLLEETSHA